MKRVSMVALAAVVSAGLVVPAAAQRTRMNEEEKERRAQKEKAEKEEKEEKAAPLKVSDKYRKVAAAADAALKAKDYATAATRIAEAESTAANDDEKFYSADMRLRLGIAQNNVADQLKAVEVLIVSPHTTPERARVLGAFQQFTLGSAAMEKKQYAEAIPLLLKARELGSTNSDVPILLANAYSSINKYAESVAEVDRAIALAKANGTKPPESWYKFAIPRVNSLGDRAATASWMARLLTDYPTIGNWRWGIVVYRDSRTRGGAALDNRTRVDLFRLMRATGSLADQQDFFDYAKVATELGLPFEALSVIDEGKKADKIPADSAAFDQVIKTAKAGAANESSPDELVKAANAGADGKDAAAAGDVFLGTKNYARAIEMYDLALKKGGVPADSVNLHRGFALVQVDRRPDALAAFATVKGEPLSDIAQFWTAYLNLPAPPTT